MKRLMCSNLTLGAEDDEKKFDWKLADTHTQYSRQNEQQVRRHRCHLPASTEIVYVCVFFFLFVHCHHVVMERQRVFRFLYFFLSLSRLRVDVIITSSKQSILNVERKFNFDFGISIGSLDTWILSKCTYLISITTSMTPTATTHIIYNFALFLYTSITCYISMWTPFFNYLHSSTILLLVNISKHSIFGIACFFFSFSSHST